jgi:hypothetical protein
MSLTISCNALSPFVIDTNQGELIRETKEGEERISCFENKANRITCFDEKDLNILNKCMRKCKEKDK